MAARLILDFGYWILDWRRAALTLVVVALGASVVSADNYAERAATIESLSTEKKAELLRKKQRFDELTDDKQQRIRDLHEQLFAEPNAAELDELMRRYCAWLRNLSSRERQEVLELPADKRIERIKVIVRRQEGQRFTEYVKYHLPKEDQEAIYKWLDEFVASHETEILDRLRDDDRRRIRAIDDAKARRKTLIQRLPLRRNDPKMPFPTPEESNQMAESLSVATRERLDKPAGTDRGDRVRELVGAAIMSIAIPPPSDDDLRKLFASLPTEEKGRLEEMDSEQMQQALHFMWRAKHFQGGRWGGFRGDGRRDDDRDGPRGPRPVGPPPPGFASPK